MPSYLGKETISPQDLLMMYENEIDLKIDYGNVKNSHAEVAFYKISVAVMKEKRFGGSFLDIETGSLISHFRPHSFSFMLSLLECWRKQLFVTYEMVKMTDKELQLIEKEEYLSCFDRIGKEKNIVLYDPVKDTPIETSRLWSQISYLKRHPELVNTR